MTTEFDTIYLAWRKGHGHGRHVVGSLRKTAERGFVFKYDKEAAAIAEKEGFTPYTEFPDLNKLYNSNVLEIFALRLIKGARPDVQGFYTFWEIEPEFKTDKFYLLGHTQGLLPTDNFEFLADYHSVEGLHFLTELTGLNTSKLTGGSLREGDKLQFVLDDKNEFDRFAVSVFKNDKEIGHIKKIHSRVFHKPGAEDLKLSVKAVDQNGIIKRVFIRVER